MVYDNKLPYVYKQTPKRGYVSPITIFTNSMEENLSKEKRIINQNQTII